MERPCPLRPPPSVPPSFVRSSAADTTNRSFSTSTGRLPPCGLLFCHPRCAHCEPAGSAVRPGDASPSDPQGDEGLVAARGRRVGFTNEPAVGVSRSGNPLDDATPPRPPAHHVRVRGGAVLAGRADSTVPPAMIQNAGPPHLRGTPLAMTQNGFACRLASGCRPRLTLLPPVDLPIRSRPAATLAASSSGRATCASSARSRSSWIVFRCRRRSTSSRTR